MPERALRILGIVSILGLVMVKMAFASPFTITDKGRPGTVIVLGKRATRLERHAGEELARYIKAISGAELKTFNVGATVGNYNNFILIGRAATNPMVKELRKEGLINLSPDYPGLDGFIIKTVSRGGKNYLVLGGSEDRGTLYAVYQFLENYLNVGFFWDGDRIPQQKTLTLAKINLVKKPYFPIRQYLQGCAFTYNYMNYWTWPQWKQQLDWVAKMKLNRMMFPFAPYRTNPTPYQKHLMELSKRAVDYARRLGIKVIINGLPSKAFLDYYGTDHIYNVGLYGEKKVGNTLEEEKQIFVKAAKETMKKMKATDPQGIWYMSGWTFYAPPRHIETVKAFLKAIPTDSFYICDIFADQYPIYRKYNYFYGKTWGFGVLNSMGGDAYLHGDLSDLIRRVKEVVHDPRAKNGKVFYINPEIIHYNTLYFDLVTQLAWNPRGITLNKFLAGYARRRYGKESSKNMLLALKELAGSVYSTNDRRTPPLYQLRLSGSFRPAYFSRARFIPRLGKALELMLRERNRQRGNQLYDHDLADISKQLLAEIFDEQIINLTNAFTAGDRKSFEKDARIVSLSLNELEKILSTNKRYWIESILEQVRKSPGVTPQVMKAAEKYIKNNTFTFVLTATKKSTNLLDYNRRDMLELVKGYYRKRVDAYIGILRQKMNDKEKVIPAGELNRRYRKIELGWFNKLLAKDKEYSGTVVEIVSGMLTKLRPIIFPKEVLYNSLQNGGFEDGFKDWKKAALNIKLEVSKDNPYAGLYSLHFSAPSEDYATSFVVSHDHDKTFGVSRQIRWRKGTQISLSYYLKKYSGVATAYLKLEGFDAEGIKKAQIVYYFGGKYWDEDTSVYTDPLRDPKLTRNSSAVAFLPPPKRELRFRFVALKENSTVNKWHHLTVAPDKDFDRTYGKGSWEKLKIKYINLELGAWAFERKGNFIEGYFDSIKTDGVK